MNMYDTASDKVLIFIINVLLIFVVIVTLYPFWEMLIISISPREEALKTGIKLFTTNPVFDAYKKVLQAPELLTTFRNTIIRVVGGTFISVILTSLTAYPLSKKYFPMNKFFTALILFTMFFSGGLIPTYLAYKNLGLLDSMWVLILPSAVSAYNLIIMRNFLRAIPTSLQESAEIDGASDFKIWYKIILPLSKPVMATVALWVAVSHWNAYFDALIYITDRNKYVLQILLRRILLEDKMDMITINQMSQSTMQTGAKPTAETVKAAILMVSTLPIICVYPFIQKYFIRGIMLGAVKG